MWVYKKVSAFLGSWHTSYVASSADPKKIPQITSADIQDSPKKVVWLYQDAQYEVLEEEWAAWSGHQKKAITKPMPQSSLLTRQTAQRQASSRTKLSGVNTTFGEESTRPMMKWLYLDLPTWQLSKTQGRAYLSLATAEKSEWLEWPSQSPDISIIEAL